MSSLLVTKFKSKIRSDFYPPLFRQVFVKQKLLFKFSQLLGGKRRPAINTLSWEIELCTLFFSVLTIFWGH